MGRILANDLDPVALAPTLVNEAGSGVLVLAPKIEAPWNSACDGVLQPRPMERRANSLGQLRLVSLVQVLTSLEETPLRRIKLRLAWTYCLRAQSIASRQVLGTGSILLSDLLARVESVRSLRSELGFLLLRFHQFLDLLSFLLEVALVSLLDLGADVKLLLGTHFVPVASLFLLMVRLRVRRALFLWDLLASVEMLLVLLTCKSVAVRPLRLPQLEDPRYVLHDLLLHRVLGFVEFLLAFLL